jgi:hypothetical protein
MSQTTISAIALLIVERPLCASCICSKTGLSNGELAGYIARIRHTFAVDDEVGRCGACGYATTVFRLNRHLTHA